jgi:type IV pilus assembly protein PilC
MAYKYVAVTPAGETVSGSLEVDSEAAAEEYLWNSGFTIIELKRAPKGLTLEEALPTIYAVRRRDVIVFSRQLATLLSSGIAIVPALQLLQEESTKRLLRKVLGQILEDIQRGQSLHESFAKHPDVFPSLFVRLIEVGEQTGNLAEILQRLANYLEKEEALIKKIRGALIYPSVILALAGVVVLVFMNFVLPAMTGLFVEFRTELPLPTRVLIALSNFIQGSFLYIIGTLVLATGLGLWYFRTPEGRRRLDFALITRVPLLRTVNIKGNMARLASILAMLLGAGLPLTEVMGLVIRTSQNVALREALEKMQTDVLAGVSLSEALSRQHLFPPMLGQMVRVGEETGALTDNLEVLARFYEEETERAVGNLISLLEPALIIGVGVFIAFMAISIITPMYAILQTIR